MDVFENRPRRQNIVVHHDVAHRLEIDAPKRLNQRERFKRRSNHNALPDRSPAKRFYADAITRAEGRPPVTVPNHKGKHSVQPFDNLWTPLAVTFNNHFRIGTCSEPSSFTGENLAKLRKIIDLAVKHNHVTTDRTLHLLITDRKIQNREPPMTKIAAAFLPLSCRIRTSMRNRIQKTPLIQLLDNRIGSENYQQPAHI